MKFWRSLLLAALTVALVTFWVLHRRSAAHENLSASSVAITAPPTTQIPGPAAVTQPLLPPPTVQSENHGPTVNETVAAVRRKLRELLEVKPGDDARTEQLLREASGMLTDQNVGDVMRSLSSDERHTVFGTAGLERWLGADPAQAAAWIAARPDTTEEEAWLVAKKLLSNPESFHAYCDALPDSEFKENLLQGGGLKALHDDPMEAAELAGRMKDESRRASLLQTIAFDWSTRDADRALAWMLTVPDAAVRETMIAAGAKAIAVNDPDLAAQWLTSSVKTESVFNETALSVVEQWVDKNPEAAASWVAHLSNPDLREAGADLVLRRWKTTNPKAVATWLMEFPEGEKVLSKWQQEEAERQKASSDDH